MASAWAEQQVAAFWKRYRMYIPDDAIADALDRARELGHWEGEIEMAEDLGTADSSCVERLKAQRNMRLQPPSPEAR